MSADVYRRLVHAVRRQRISSSGVYALARGFRVPVIRTVYVSSAGLWVGE